jgi:hypothetical protein
MHNFVADHPLLFATGLLLVIAVFWTLVVNLISLASGWRALASHFRAQQRFLGQKWRFQSAAMRRSASYNGCLTAGADAMGLFLEMMYLFRPGHPALFIPWTEITVRREPWQPNEPVEIKLGSSEQISFRILGTLASKLQANAGSYWVLDLDQDERYPQGGPGHSGPETGKRSPSTRRVVIK